jgi:hypothetical protein
VSDETPPVFRLVRFNPRRMRPGCSGAAEVEIDDGENSCRLWMTLRDVERNIIEFGRHPGLVAALEAYRNRVEILDQPRTPEPPCPS